MPAKREHANPAANAVVANANAQKQAPSSVAVAIANVPMTVRWGDLDAFNHVNNAAFLVYAQEARLAWLAGIDGVWVDGTMMPVVAAAQVNFRRQLAWPAQIAVELVATRVGTTSLTIAHRIVAANDRECVYADGDIVMVWINPDTGRSVALPPAIRAACQSPFESGATTSK
ncbi:MAG: thioesterase family protein [Dokdonella sp.]